MTNTATITGTAAIEIAEDLGLTLSKHADPTEDAREGLSVSKAYEIAKHDPSLVYLAVAAVVSAHGEREGREDYEGRAADVDRGAEPESWAWPLVGADEAYINAVMPSGICEACGLYADAWDDISDEWIAAFKRGYEAAHAEAQ
jgi:hypothetical protein